MNRYPVWTYAVVLATVLLGLLYTLPNFYGEVPAVQLSSARATIKVDAGTLARVEDTLGKAGIKPTGLQLDSNSIKVRLTDTDTQLKAKDLISQALNSDPQAPSYTVALNLVSSSPAWLTAMHALPMYLGLDLRGGVHFLLQVDMKAALTKKLDSLSGDIRSQLKSKNIRFGGISREGQSVIISFRDPDARESAKRLISNFTTDLTLLEAGEKQDLKLVASLKAEAQRAAQESALAQNIFILKKRIDQLGVNEPIIQQQGGQRIVVQLPGIQDVARAKGIIGRTATLEVRLVNEDATNSGSSFGVDVFPETRRDGSTTNVAVKKQIVLTGDRFFKAEATIDQEQKPAVSVELDDAGGRVMREVTREHLYKKMAIILFERGKGEAISVATIQGEFGNKFQISGQFSVEETLNLSLLIRAGALAAPMEIVEERTIGPSLGADNIRKGFNSTIGGFLAIAAFMTVYYSMFGLFSAVALSANLLLLIALLSLLQATLTLPGIAAIALTLGMAIDANVLINERIREELRNGATPQAAIHAGYERAFGTIVDSNITSFIAGGALLMFGSGPVRGFAVVHCLGILTSIFSSVVVSRCLVNLTYGNRKKLTKVAIGDTSWK